MLKKGGDNIESILENLIGNYAFPIVMCIILFLDGKQTREAHKEETTLLRESVDACKQAISELTRMIRGDRN